MTVDLIYTSVVFSTEGRVCGLSTQRGGQETRSHRIGRLIAAGVVIAITTMASAAVATAAPSSGLPPRINGDWTSGSSLTVDPGTWTSSDNSAITYGYQWQDCGVPSTYPTAVESIGSNRGYWRLNDVTGSTTAANSSPYHTTTFTNPPRYIYAPDGVASSGVQFGGSGVLSDGTSGAAFGGPTGSSYITLADWSGIHLNDTFSIELWMRRTSAGVGGYLVSDPSGGTSGQGWELRVGSDNKVHFDVPAVGDIAASTTTVPADGLFHLIDATKSGAAVHLYVDGSDVTGTVTNHTVSFSTVGLVFGRQTATTTTGALSGSMTDVALYASALTAGDVSSHDAQSCTSIAGQTSSSHTLSSGEVNNSVNVSAQVTATDDTGSSTASSLSWEGPSCEVEGSAILTSALCTPSTSPAQPSTSDTIDCSGAVVCQGSYTDLSNAGFDTTGLSANDSAAQSAATSTSDAQAVINTSSSSYMAWIEFYLYNNKNCSGTVKFNNECGWLYHKYTVYVNGNPQGQPVVSAIPGRSGDNIPSHMWQPSVGPLPSDVTFKWGYMNGKYTGFEPSSDDHYYPGQWRLDPWSVTKNGVTRGALEIHGGRNAHDFWSTQTNGCIRLPQGGITTLQSLYANRTSDQKTNGGPNVNAYYN